MKRHAFSLLLLLVLPLMTAAHAQERRHRSVGLATLTAHPAVYKELKLTEDQTVALKRANTTARKGLEANKKLDQKERRAKNRPVNQKLREAIAKTLNSDQKKRLLQIEIQYSGASILRRKDVSDTLELTKDQRREIRTITKKSSETATKLRATLNNDNRRDVQKQIADDVAATRKAAITLLTEDQQKKWKKAIGRPFALPKRGRKKTNSDKQK